MATGKKTGGRDFKAGHSVGRPPMPQEVKIIRQVTREDLIDLAMMVMKGDVEALREVIARAQDKDPAKRPTPIQLLMASCLMKAIKNGDSTVLNSLLDRFFGRAPIAIQVQHTDKPAAGSTAKEIVFETVAVPVEVPRAATG